MLTNRVLFFLFLSVSILHAELRTFTNEWGDSIKAELIELKDKNVVTMRLENGREIDADLTAFSEDDQKYIRKWWKGREADKMVLDPGARLDITVKMNRKSKDTYYDGWYADDKIKSFFPEILIDNDDLQKFTGNTVRLVVFAEDKRYTDRILVVSEKDIKTDLEGNDKTRLESKPFRLRFYEYKSSYSSYEYAYGYEYTGYAITIKNSKGEVTHEKASKSKYLNPKHFYKCKTGQIYDDGFERKLNEEPNSYFVN